jgi:hypothetical protein
MGSGKTFVGAPNRDQKSQSDKNSLPKKSD